MINPGLLSPMQFTTIWSMEDPEFWKRAREDMVNNQIKRRGISDPRLLEVFGTVPRHRFVTPSDHDQAYNDYPLSIGEGQTISQPYIVAYMTDLLDLKGDEIVLEVGTGSGYQAAILSYLVKTVHTIERLDHLAQNAQKILDDLKIRNVYIHIGDGSKGWPEASPYDGILVTAAAPSAPQPLLDQLAKGGRLVIPVGGRYNQDLQLWKKHDSQVTREYCLAVAFVPLRGEHGWGNDEW
jgi:protein-L-isoaspartate(D-aspartate) O-methyltransferase